MPPDAFLASPAQFGASSSGLRKNERVLLETLYSVGASASPEPTPPMEPAAALPAARVPRAASLWTSAARCEQVTEDLGARIEKRRAARPGPEPEEGLHRGGVRYTHADESRALKAVKLQALQDELKTHESTVKELRRLIAQLEAELGS